MTNTRENASILQGQDVEELIRLALREDGVDRDLTTLACDLDSPSAKQVRATILAKSKTIACGYPLVPAILSLAGSANRLRPSKLAEEGQSLSANAPWIILEGAASDLLRLERTILNFLMRMCGIAAHTRNVIDALAGTGCKLLHTRKTAPGHRRLDVYSAITGGAHPHRRSLSEAILVKENHLSTASSIQAIFDGIEEYRAEASFVEIEVRDFTELKYAMTARPDRILLDNFKVEDVRKIVELFGSSVVLEASGGITPKTARAFAETGVDYISMGSITHSAPAADLSMLFDWNP